jgi:hypothetical protein
MAEKKKSGLEAYVWIKISKVSKFLVLEDKKLLVSPYE